KARAARRPPLLRPLKLTSHRGAFAPRPALLLGAAGTAGILLLLGPARLRLVRLGRRAALAGLLLPPCRAVGSDLARGGRRQRAVAALAAVHDRRLLGAREMLA